MAISKTGYGNLETGYGNLENRNLEAILISKIREMGISKNRCGHLKFNLKNDNLEESDAKPGPVVGNLTLLGT